MSKLYQINEQVCLDLINLWRIYNTTYKKCKPIIINDISCNYEIINKINSLFEKLDFELMSMFKKEDKHTLKLLNLEDIDSYQKLYMLIVAPQEVEDIRYKIQKLHKKFIDNKSFDLLENLEKIEQEVEDIKYQIQKMNRKFIEWESFYLLDNLEKIEQKIDEKYLNENSYLEYRKWYKKIEEQLENMNDEKYINEKAKQNYKQIIKK